MWYPTFLQSIQRLWRCFKTNEIACNSLRHLAANHPQLLAAVMRKSSAFKVLIWHPSSVVHKAMVEGDLQWNGNIENRRQRDRNLPFWFESFFSSIFAFSCAFQVKRCKFDAKTSIFGQIRPIFEVDDHRQLFLRLPRLSFARSIGNLFLYQMSHLPNFWKSNFLISN